MNWVYMLLLFWGGFNLQEPDIPAEPPPEEVETTEAQTPEPMTETENNPQEAAEPPAQLDVENSEDSTQKEPLSESELPETEALPAEETLPTQAATPLPHSGEPVVDYQINVKLHPDRRLLTGTLKLQYVNHSPDIISDLMFHLYPNAFRNNASAYYYGGRSNHNPEFWSYIDLTSLQLDGKDRLTALSWPGAPNSPGDRTTAQLPLDAPLFPGQKILVEITFETLIPKASSRMGHDGDQFYFVAQWFPKIGVWETKGHRGRDTAGWNCHPFYRRPEFYANFGNYEVSIETPQEYVVGATGSLVETTDLQGTQPYRRHVFKQDRVHDFAWTASPKALLLEREFIPEEYVSEAEIQAAMALHQLPREDVMLRPVNMKLFIPLEFANQADRHFQALAQAIKYFGLWYGPYPYKTITMVEPTSEGSAVGGMEYPTLITLGTRVWNPTLDLDLEDVTVHEFGHQYWYGMVATNETEDAWMDEGLNTYCTAKVLDKAWGITPDYSSLRSLRRNFDLSVPGFNPHYLDDLRIRTDQIMGFSNPSQMEMLAMGAPYEKGRDAIASNAWEFHPYGYGSNAYSKPAQAFYQLELELGADVMARVLRTYFQTWAFKHPAPRDLNDVVNHVSGRNMDWFFHELFEKPGQLDYKVGLVTSETIDMNSGYQDNENGGSALTSAKDNAVPEAKDDAVPEDKDDTVPEDKDDTVPKDKDDAVPKDKDDAVPDQYFNRVIIEKTGTINYPVQIRVTFLDGTRETVSWDGSSPWKAFQFNHNAYIERVEIDPEHKLVIDTNPVNNSYLATPNPKPAKRIFERWVVKAQHILQTLVGGL